MDVLAISIIVPVFNTGAYLRESIESILLQAPAHNTLVPPFEIIIVDDGSDDPITLALMKELADDDHRVRLLQNDRKKGVAGARNTGIQNAMGKWIAFLDSDDVWLPGALAVRWNLILDHPEARWVGANFKLLKPTNIDNKESFPSLAKLLGQDHQPRDVPPFACLRKPVEAFGEKCALGIMTVMIDRDLLLQKGLFSEDLQRAEDYHLWFKCAFDQDLWMVMDEIAYYRIHSASLTHRKSPRHLYEDLMIANLLRLPAGKIHAKLLRRRLDFVLQDHCYFYRQQRQFGNALRFAITRVRQSPFKTKAWKELLACSLRAA